MKNVTCSFAVRTFAQLCLMVVIACRLHDRQHLELRPRLHRQDQLVALNHRQANDMVEDEWRGDARRVRARPSTTVGS